MNNKIKTILMAAIMSSVVLTQGVCVSAAQFDDGASAFSDGTGSVSALASTLAKQTEEQTQEFVAKEEEAAQIREERRVEKAEKASEKAEQEKTAALESIQQTVEDTKKKIAEEAEAKRLAKRQEVVNFALQFEGNPYTGYVDRVCMTLSTFPTSRHSLCNLSNHIILGVTAIP